MDSEVERLRKENAVLKAENERLTTKLALMEKSFADLFVKMKEYRDSPVQHVSGSSSPVAPGSAGSALSNFFKTPRGGTKTLPSEAKTVRAKRSPFMAHPAAEQTGGSVSSSNATPRFLGTVGPDTDELGRRRSRTLDGREDFDVKVKQRVSASIISPRDVEVGVLHKAWGVALRDHFDSGVTVPSAVSHLVSHIKQFVLLSDDEAASTISRSPKKALFEGLTGVEDTKVRGLLEFGESVPRDTPVDTSCELLISFLRSLPDPVIVPEAAQLLVDAFSISDPDYQLQSIRSIIQSSLPYNHRVLLQLLVSMLTRMRDANMNLEFALQTLSAAIFPPSFNAGDAVGATPKAILALIMAKNESFPTSNAAVQYMVEKSSHGKMLVKSAESSSVMAMLTHRFTQEPRTTSALLALHGKWLQNPVDLLTELSTQHARFVSEKSNWALSARLHVVFLAQQFLESCPELLMSDSFWQTLRKTARAWQKECVDGGEPERKLRKFLKLAHRRVNGAMAELSSNLESLSSLKQTGVAIEFPKLVAEVDAKVVAEQICLIDLMWFRAVPKSELLSELSSNNVETTAPNWYRMIRSFNLISQWVISSILLSPLPSSRAELIVFFLKVADHLQNVLANFNASYAIISALSEPSVERLKLSWSRLSQPFVDLYDKLQELWSVSRNFSRYRAELSKARNMPPAIPYCGLLSKDLFAVQENNRSDVVESPAGGGSHVNVDKLRLIWDKLESFVRLQYTSEYSRCLPILPVQCFILRLGEKTNGFAFLDPSAYKAASLALEKRANAPE